MRQRVVMAFVVRGEEVLLVRRKHAAAPYPDRLSTAAGPLGHGETPQEAGRRAVAHEMGIEVEPVRAGLPLEFTDTVRKRSVTFRVYPVLCRTAGEPRIEDSRWLTPDELIVRAAFGETVPELDEALARVWDPPEALPPLFRDEARAIHRDRTATSVDLAVRAAALVQGGAPPERVAALRPARARVVNAARAAARAGRDVPGELARAQAALVRLVADEARHAVGDPPLVATAEAVTARGDAVVRAGTLGAARIWVAADPWTEWEDDVPPPLEPDLELVPRARYERLVTLPS